MFVNIYLKININATMIMSELSHIIVESIHLLLFIPYATTYQHHGFCPLDFSIFNLRFQSHILCPNSFATTHFVVTYSTFDMHHIDMTSPVSFLQLLLKFDEYPI